MARADKYVFIIETLSDDQFAELVRKSSEGLEVCGNGTDDMDDEPGAEEFPTPAPVTRICPKCGVRMVGHRLATCCLE